MQQDHFAVSVLQGWFNANQEYFTETKMVSEFKDSGQNSACINLESDSHIMQLCAWDHASCLDIQILEIASEKSTFPHTGDCKNKIEFESELNDFLEWHKNEFKNT